MMVKVLLPAETDDNSLIYFVNQSAKIMLKNYISKHIKKGNRMLYFGLAGGQNAAKIADEMADFADQILLESEEKMDVSKKVNDNMNTCRITLR